MKPLVFLVEDNEDLLYTIKLSLETNNYRVLSARNGKEGLRVLSQQDEIPEIIISDIMMPEMDGYEFFSKISKNPHLNRIPFIFLTARTSPREIKFGKLLGVDDYLTKPFREEDLLTVVAGKINRNRKIFTINEKVNEAITSFNISVDPSISVDEKENVILLLMYWDDVYGPQLQVHHPTDIIHPFSVEKVASQLFQASILIYGHGKITLADGILLNINNINMKGYAYFNAFPDENERFGEKQYMLAIIAPNISYFDSLKIKKIFTEISMKINQKANWEVKKAWQEIFEILTTGFL